MSKHNQNHEKSNTLFSSFKTLIHDLTNINNNGSNSNGNNRVDHNAEEKSIPKKQKINSSSSHNSRKLFPQSIESLENKLPDQVEKVRKVLDHPKASVNQLESGDRALDDLICLISSQLNVASQLKRDNHQRLVDKLKDRPTEESNQKSKVEDKSDNSMPLINLSFDQNAQIPITTNNTNNGHNIWHDLLDSTDKIDSLEYDPRCDKSSESLFCELPYDILIHIGTFLFAKDLLNIGQCNAKLLKLFLNQTSYKSGSLLMLKYSFHFDYTKKDLANKLLLEEQIQEYQKDENESFSQVQEFIWKPLVCFFFPRFNKALNISNWMHTLRRRIAHIRLYEPHKLPLFLNQNSDNQDTLYTVSHNTVTVPFIENCEWIYKVCLQFYNSKYLQNPSVLSILMIQHFHPLKLMLNIAMFVPRMFTLPPPNRSF